jgi:hypothetical protein
MGSFAPPESSGLAAKKDNTDVKDIRNLFGSDVGPGGNPDIGDLGVGSAGPFQHYRAWHRYAGPGFVNSQLAVA